jgi:hypothetical protein
MPSRRPRFRWSIAKATLRILLVSLPGAFLAAATFSSGAAPAAAPAPAAALFSVAILRPQPGQVLFGDVEVEIAVHAAGAPVESVEIYFDGVRAAVLERPPWRAVLQAGQENVEHRLEVVARDAAGRTATAGLAAPRIRSDLEVRVELRQLYVRVERTGAAVLDLERGDFTVLDGGAPQRLVAFARGDAPFTAALLLDASTSMRGESDVEPALQRLLRELREQYLLGYQPAGGRAGSEGWREVRVQVRGDGLTVRAPRGYLP